MSEKNENLRSNLANFIKKAKEDKIVSYEEINSVLSDDFSVEKTEKLIKKLIDVGVQIVDTLKDKQDLIESAELLEEMENGEIDVSEMDIDERKYRVDDAVSATKVALLDGVAIGGGVALLNASKDITIDGVSSYNAGKQILKESLKQPFKQLVNNSGLNAEALIDKVENAKSGYGVNVATGELVDLYKEGIIDPLKVLKEVVKNSVSIASNAMTMGALVVDLPEEKDLPLNNGL